MTVVDRRETPTTGSTARGPGLRPRSTRPKIRTGFALAQTALYFVVMVAASATLWPIYRSSAFLILLVGGFALGATIALAGLFLRLASVWILALLIVAFGVFGVALAVPNQALYGVLPTVDGLRELVGGVALGWKQLLTITLPVGDYQALLVPALVLVLAGTTVGLSTAFRSRRAELALVPPVLIYLVGIVLGPREPLLPLVTGLVLLAVSVLWIVWWRLRRRRLAIDLLTRGTAAGRRRPSGGEARGRSGHGAVARRAVAGTLLTLVVATAAGAAVTGAIGPKSSRWVARDAVQTPFDPRDYVSPLSGFRAYEQSAEADTPQITVTGLGAGGFVRIATLDTYDGVQYSVGSDEVSTASGTFTRVPTSIDQAQVRGRQVTIDVAVDGYTGVWVPTVGKLESIDFSGSRSTALRDAFFYNDTTGTAAVLGGLAQDDSYRLTAVEPQQPSRAALQSLTPGDATVPAPTKVPSALTAALESYVDGVQGQGPRLQAALDGLKKNGYVSHGVGSDEPASLSGHGADRLTRLFTDNLMIGDGEQYAAAAALMADELGFPARVVLGFAGSSSTGGTATFTGSDITAHIEVDTAQYGWVSLDPNPEPREIPKDQQVDPNQVSRPQSVIQPPQQEADPPNDQTQPQSRQDSPTDPPAWIALLVAAGRIAGWAALIAGLVMSPFLAIVAVKGRRRVRRRRARDPGVRMTHGWQEYHDAVVDHGIPTPSAATRSEVAAAVGSTRAGVLARVVDRAVFAPEPPSAPDADRVWKAVGEMRTHLDTGLTRWQRFRAAVSTRSLRGYHGRKPFKR